jgi:PAS domain-containing protein
MTRSSAYLQRVPSAVLRYGLAVGSVLIALGPALVLQHFKYNDVALPFFLFAVGLTAWHAGVGPAIVSIVLSSLCLTYFFLPPLYSFYFTVTDLPAMVILVAFAALITWFSSIRRRVEAQLLQARDQLQLEVEERTQQASLLNLTHDTIFVRDLSDVITYWNRGAQELYGWTPEEAVGIRSHDLLTPSFQRRLTK